MLLLKSFHWTRPQNQGSDRFGGPASLESNPPLWRTQSLWQSPVQLWHCWVLMLMRFWRIHWAQSISVDLKWCQDQSLLPIATADTSLDSLQDSLGMELHVIWEKWKPRWIRALSYCMRIPLDAGRSRWRVLDWHHTLGRPATAFSRLHFMCHIMLWYSDWLLTFKIIILEMPIPLFFSFLKIFVLCVFFRQADGRKVLRSSIREFLCSEAVFALGVPSTRAGSVVTSDSRVMRDINYDGNPRMERCSVVLRIAPSFIR